MLLKNITLSFIKSMVRNAELKFAYFFALLVFISVLCLTIYGKDISWVGSIGVLCLFLIKLPDIILCAKGKQQSYPETQKTLVCTSPLTQKNTFDFASKVVTNMEQGYLFYLEKKYNLSKKQSRHLAFLLKQENQNDFLLQAQLETYGITADKVETVLNGFQILQIIKSSCLFLIKNT